jgi:two-component system phosphate regulon sensor histidine kinase PhoR
MTISLIVFVTLQFYWLKNYYGALEQEFSNKVYSALESTSKNMEEIEVDKYLNIDNKDFRNNILANSDQPTLTTIQQVEDSGTQRQIIYSKNIIEKSQLPISKQGDSIKLTKLYSDEAAYKIKRDTTNREILTADINQDLENGDYAMKEYAKIIGNNLPISKRVDAKI